MPEPSFSRPAEGGDFYWLPESAAPDGYGVGLLLPEGSGSAPGTISLAQSWTQYPGLYVMVGARPSGPDAAGFLAALRRFQALLGPLLRFLWIGDAKADPGAWPQRAILVDQSPGASAGTVAAAADLPFGDYRLSIASGQTIAPTSEGFALTGGGPWAFSLRTTSSAWALSAPSGSPGTAISFATGSAGCVELDLSLPQDHEQSGVDDYTRLDAGFRFAVEEASPWPLERLLTSLSCPLFERVPAATQVSLAGRFDPLLPLDPTRTRLAYASGTPVHASSYRDPLGHRVTLTPAAGGALPAGLAFHRRPGSLHGTPLDDPLYLGPIGPFAAAVEAGLPSGGSPVAPAARLACGLAGTEYFGLSSRTAAIVAFSPGGDACFAPPTGEPAGTRPVFDGRATAPWGTVMPATGEQAWYYAQPEGGSLHRFRAGNDGGSLLDYLVYLELPAGSVESASAPPAYPLVPYAQVSAPRLKAYCELEAKVLAPKRRQVLAPKPLTPATVQTVPAVTPQGLLSEFTTDLASWKRLSLVPAPEAPSTDPSSLAFNDLGDDLRQAFQANELFLVAADGAKLAGAAELNYWLDPAALEDLEALHEPPPQAVIEKLRTGAVAPQVGEAAFKQMLEGVLTTDDERRWIPTILEYGVYFEIVIAEWRFRLSPLLWKQLSEFPTLMVVKFAGSRLGSLVADPESWTWPAAAGADEKERQKVAERLTDIVEHAREQVKAAAGAADPLDFFVETVCEDPAWSGVLFLDAQVPFSSMPEELRGLAAGIDAEKFRAHHVGLSVTPVQVDASARTISLASSSFFGLIDYESPEDIAHTFDDFAFKVLQLRVLFRDSAVADFASRVELFVNRLFGEGVALLQSEHYNNLILIGSYQRQQGKGHYAFATAGAGVFASQSAVVEEVEIARAQFATSPPSPDKKVHSRFRMWGRLRFHQLAGFDLFSFGYEVDEESRRGEDGYLAFAGLAVDMEFTESDPAGRTLVLDVTDVAFDPVASRARPASFFARFPLTLAGMVTSGSGKTPKDLGFEPVETPLAQPSLGGGWYAIAFTVDLGTLGALAAEAGLVVTLLAAWGPSESEPAVNVGLRLPGSQSLKSLPAIEGVLQFGFQSIVLEASGPLAEAPGPAYIMRFRHFSLRLLGWRFPPGQADVYLFGDPEAGPTQRGALGWYAAYLKEGE